MNLQIKDKYFLVTGASSGFGRAIAMALVNEGAMVYANARSEEHLKTLKDWAPNQVEYKVADITIPRFQDEVLNMCGQNKLSGALINSGGPPALSATEAKLIEWDNAYKSVLRWKVRITKALTRRFLRDGYGRMLFIESVSVKQPVENLVLSNAFRMAMVGYIKTLSQEIGHKGITMNIMAPSYHDTNAMQRIILKKSQVQGINTDQARKQIESETITGKMGDADDFASLALWLLSPYSRFVTGQIYAVDGGIIKGV